MENRRGLPMFSAAILFCAVSGAFAFPIVRDTMPNGLAVLTSEDHHLPIVSIQLSVRAGSAMDPANQDGVANVVSTLLARGTKTLSATELNQRIEYVGGRLGAGSDLDHTTVSLQVLTKDLDLALNLLADIVLSPSFSDSELTRARREIASAIKRQVDEPDDLLGQEFNRRLFGNHPYAHPGIGYDTTVSSLTRQQVLDFYQTWFVPNNSYICAVGDFDARELRAKLAVRFGAWLRRPVPELKVAELPVISRPTGFIISRPEMNQAHILLGHVGIREGAPDAFACRLMNFTLGGSVFSSRIGTAIREDRGLAYDARSGFSRMGLTGAFIASTETRTDSAQTALNILLKQLSDVREKGLSAKELQRSKDYFLGNFPLNYESTRERLGALDRIELYHLGLDYLDKFAENVNKVTEADVLKAAQDHVFPDRYLLVIAGNLTEKDINLPGLEWQK